MDFFRFDTGYVERLAAGDAAVEQHFSRYFGELIFIKLRTRRYSTQTIEDIRQETFLRVFQALRRDGIRQPERIGAFVNSVCNNVVLEYARNGSRLIFLDETPDRADGEPDLERRLIDDEQRELVRRLLAEMPGRNRELLTAVFLDERPPDEVCRELGIDRGYLRVLLFRARAQLKTRIRKPSRTRDAAGRRR